MSKMPAKKKSCFQITSVTQAQVAASSITDDTESLDDPDESRTEDVSSEIFDVSRADLEPEVCERSSSDETLNNVGGESEAHGVMALHIPQDGQLPAVSGPPNGGFAFRSTAVSGVAHVSPHVLAASAPAGPPPATVSQQSAPVSAGGAANVTIGTSQPPPAAPTVTASSTTTTTASCSSRFRVIKLDHGTGEPFRRGRWTCMEFYDKDSEGSSVISRTVDNVKPTGAFDQNLDRDSGLGATGSLVVAPLCARHPRGLTPQLTLPVWPLLTCTRSIHSSRATASGTSPPTGPSSLLATLAANPWRFPRSRRSRLASSSLPRTSSRRATMACPCRNLPACPPATQSQQFAYPAAHHLPSVSPVSQADYRHPLQQPQLLSATTAAQTLPVASLPMGPPVSQGPSPVMTPATVGAQVLGLLVQPGETVAASLPAGQPPAPAQGLLQQPMAVGGGPPFPPLSRPAASSSSCPRDWPGSSRSPSAPTRQQRLRPLVSRMCLLPRRAPPALL
ncbi:hypothetical protein SKAU_G00049170 [Synaphobranchus kaupii]|uniref:TSC22 domain family member 2 n=1 Tax=Synaphobranchus kaupii TaxID=118154 RepID=A0A9Q1G3M9_SYNKA|nr:hypothetical protein SKAU_G00049170 [Synaphobranchus kaupii]